MSDQKQEELSEAISHLLEECRMVLPGIQALFGFQLVVVFNQRFDKISSGDQVLHLIATVLVAISAALVMTPAAYHRVVHPRGVSERFLRICTWLLLASMVLLTGGICADVFIISDVILESRTLAAAVAGFVFVVLVTLWFLFPCCQLKPR
ncbi:MAG: DUF6328 family protein [Pirellulales bacterium]